MDVEGWRRRLLFLAAALAPAGLILVPSLVTSPRAVTHELFAYSGTGDHGWLAIARIIHVLRTGTLIQPEKLGGVLLAAKILFLLAYGAALFYWARKPDRRPSLVGRIAFSFMLFDVLYGGISSQMLLWALPFLLLVAFRDGVLYSAAATVSVVSFYATLYPALLYLGPPAGTGQLLTRILLWLFATAVWWLLTIWWTARTGRGFLAARSLSPAPLTPESS
jgi:hypothetical protein